MNTENAETDKFQEEAIAPMHTAEHLLNRTMVTNSDVSDRVTRT